MCVSSRGWVVACLAMVACTNDGALTVDLVTDLIPGTDYVATRVRLMPDAEREDMRFSFWENVSSAHRIARFEELSDGAWEARIDLLDARGVPVYSRGLVAEVNGPTGVTVLATRNCVGMVCDEGQLCHGERCVDPGCTVENPEECGAGCEGDEDCADVGMCDAVCYAGACIVNVVDRCDDTQWCHPDDGCIDRLAGFEVTFTVVNEGPGLVTSDIGDCPAASTCELVADYGATVRFQATAEEGNEFWGWSGRDLDCSGNSDCQLIASQPLTIHAVFAPSVYEVETLELVDAQGESFGIVFGGLAFLNGDLLASNIATDSIVRIGLDGRVEAFAGSGAAGVDLEPTPAAQASFTEPRGLAVDAAGNVYVADRGSNRVRMISAAGIVSVFAGSGEGAPMDGPALEAVLDDPHQVSWYEGNQTLYVSTGSAVRAVRDGMVTTVPGVPGNRTELTSDPDGNLYWSDHAALWQLSPGGSPVVYHESPCGRPDAASSAFRTVWLPTGDVVELVCTWGICRVATDGSSQRLLLGHGVGVIDGPDYLARTRSAEYPLVGGPDGIIAMVDLYPGAQLRLLRPR